MKNLSLSLQLQEDSTASVHIKDSFELVLFFNNEKFKLLCLKGNLETGYLASLICQGKLSTYLWQRTGWIFFNLNIFALHVEKLTSNLCEASILVYNYVMWISIYSRYKVWVLWDGSLCIPLYAFAHHHDISLSTLCTSQNLWLWGQMQSAREQHLDIWFPWDHA